MSLICGMNAIDAAPSKTPIGWLVMFARGTRGRGRRARPRRRARPKPREARREPRRRASSIPRGLHATRDDDHEEAREEHENADRADRRDEEDRSPLRDLAGRREELA